jgi:hypothetical protein
MKFEEKIEAIKLRKSGVGYSEILRKIRVSKSTLSIWLKDIELNPSQKERLFKGREISRYAGAKARQRMRIEKTKEIIKEAKKELNSLIDKELFLSGLMLYWAEGAKTSEVIKFSNSDPLMIKLMMRWFREICGVPESKFRIALHIHELLSRKNIEEYWSKTTNIPLGQFQKTFIKPTSLGQRRNILYKGTCVICVYDKDLFRKMNGWKIGFLEKIGIN